MKINIEFMDRVKDIIQNPKNYPVMDGSGPSFDHGHELATKVIVGELYRIAKTYDDAGINPTPKKFIEKFSFALDMDVGKDLVFPSLKG